VQAYSKILESSQVLLNVGQSRAADLRGGAGGPRGKGRKPGGGGPGATTTPGSGFYQAKVEVNQDCESAGKKIDSWYSGGVRRSCDQQDSGEDEVAPLSGNLTRPSADRERGPRDRGGPGSPVSTCRRGSTCNQPNCLDHYNLRGRSHEAGIVCTRGPNCFYLKQGVCHFYHPRGDRPARRHSRAF
jgi:hypothetical protein